MSSLAVTGSLLLILLPSIISGKIPEIPDGFTKGGDGYHYKYYARREDWYVADRTCKGEGGNLAVIFNQKTRDVVRGFMSEGWIGISDQWNEGTWQTSTKKDLQYTSWAKGEPNNARRREHCGVQRSDKKWNDINCSFKRSFICQISTGYSSWSQWTGCKYCTRSSRARRSRTLYCPNNSCPGQQSQTETKACSTSVRSSCRGTCEKREGYCKSESWFPFFYYCKVENYTYLRILSSCTKTTWDDTHFETLDNKFYEFDGECAYNYLTDKKRSFNLIIYTVPCGQLTNRTGTCLDQIDVNYKNTSISLEKDLKLKISNKYLDLPFENEDLDIHEASAEFVQVQFSNGISFLWNGDEIALDVPESLIGQYPDYKIFGLVGPYNNNSNDDFTSPDGKLLDSPKAFGESWKVPGSCVDHTELKKKIALKAMQKMKKYQKQNKDAAMVAEQQCNIMKTGIFKLCHDKMDPNQFKNLHNACVWDVSLCVGDISECLCPTLEVLSEECHQSGFAVGNWRKTISQCEKICQNGDVFQQCASPCNRTCQHMQSANICLETCVEGCACPKGMTRDVPGKRGKCIPHENCGCKFENHSYTKGQSISRYGMKITCDGTFWLKEKGAE